MQIFDYRSPEAGKLSLNIVCGSNTEAKFYPWQVRNHQYNVA